jgi:hypothetical protein
MADNKPAAGGQPASGPKDRLAEGDHYPSKQTERKALLPPPLLRGLDYAALNGVKPREGEWEINCPVPQLPGFSHRCRFRETPSGLVTIKCYGGHSPGQVRNWLKHHWAASNARGEDE